MRELTESDLSTPLVLPTGERFALTLPENRTTGYSWQLLADGQPVACLVRETPGTASTTPGRGTTRRWEFAAAAVGTTIIRFASHRAWQPQQQLPSRVIELHVQVVPSVPTIPGQP